MSNTHTIALKLSLDGLPQTRAGLQGVSGDLARIGPQAGGAGGAAERLSAALGRVAHYGVAGGGLYAVASAAQAVGGAVFQACVSAQNLATQHRPPVMVGAD